MHAAERGGIAVGFGSSGFCFWQPRVKQSLQQHQPMGASLIISCKELDVLPLLPHTPPSPLKSHNHNFTSHDEQVLEAPNPAG